MQFDISQFKLRNVCLERGQIDFAGEFFKPFGIQIDAIDIVSYIDIVRSFQDILF